MDQHRQAASLDRNDVEDLVVRLGYEPISVSQEWRHVGARIRKDGADFFMKLASTEVIGSQRTRNEAAWNSAAGPLVPSWLQIPPVYSQGRWNGLFYYVTDYYGGSALLTDQDAEGRDIQATVDVTLAILAVSGISLPRDADPNGPANQESFITKAQEVWLPSNENPADRLRLQSLLNQSASVIADNWRPAVQHGDFAPGHLLRQGERIVLIDGEAASTLYCRYYDAVYFYHRLYTKSARPDLAKQYRNQLESRLPADESPHFAQLFPALLGLRTIGGFYDHYQKDGTQLELHRQLLNDLSK